MGWSAKTATINTTSCHVPKGKDAHFIILAMNSLEMVSMTLSFVLIVRHLRASRHGVAIPLVQLIEKLYLRSAVIVVVCWIILGVVLHFQTGLYGKNKTAVSNARQVISCLILYVCTSITSKSSADGHESQV
jgi:hypothetical protein